MTDTLSVMTDSSPGRPEPPGQRGVPGPSEAGGPHLAFKRHEALPFPKVTGYWVNRLANAFRTAVDRELRGFDLTRRQVGMLHFIAREDCTTASDLTRTIGVDSTAVTRMIDRLESKGLVIRKPDPEDGRRHMIEVTAAARQVMPKLAETAMKVEAPFEEGIPDEDLDAFHRVLMRMLENVDEAHYAMICDE